MLVWDVELILVEQLIHIELHFVVIVQFMKVIKSFVQMKCMLFIYAKYWKGSLRLISFLFKLHFLLSWVFSALIPKIVYKKKLCGGGGTINSFKTSLMFYIFMISYCVSD
jgi:hypothetical protein